MLRNAKNCPEPSGQSPRAAKITLTCYEARKHSAAEDRRQSVAEACGRDTGAAKPEDEILTNLTFTESHK